MSNKRPHELFHGNNLSILPKMSTGLSESTRLSDDFAEDSREYSPDSPPENKRMKLDDGCNNNLNSTLNSASKNEGRWTCPVDTSLVEQEVMVDLGVSMLEDEETSCESIKKLKSQECTLSPTSSDCSRHAPLKADKNNDDDDDDENTIERIFRGSDFETDASDRLEKKENTNMEDPGTVLNTMGNESGYSSRVDIDVFVDKQNLSRDDSNLDTSSLDQFYLFRRKKKNSLVGEDKFNKLSDEMILMILKWLPKKCLVRSMLVCKRWCQIARDEALWTRLDLGGKVLSEGTLGHILPRGVQILRLAQAEFADPLFLPGCEVLTDGYSSRLQYLDLSMTVISPQGLAALLSRCRTLKKLSLEKCTLNEICCKAINSNPDISVLNLTMCEGITQNCVEHLVKLKSLNSLNMAWCSLETKSIEKLCKSLPHSITRLNISGCRKTLTDDMVKALVASCPNLVELDLSDCTMLTINTAQSIMNLTRLEHLSLSRCYSIPPSTYLRLTYMPSLMYLDVFGLIAETNLKSLQANRNSTEINKFLYSSVARPTVGVRRTSIWGLRVRD